MLLCVAAHAAAPVITELRPRGAEIGRPFTLTAAEGTSLGLGEIGPGSLTFTGQMYWKDAIPPLGQPYRFTLSTSTPLTIDPSCIEADHVTGGSVEGLLNGSGPVTFTRTWTACGAATSIVDGTTD